MTKDEKAKKYDALQGTFKFTLHNYRRRKIEAEGKYVEANIIGAYNKGLADAYSQILEDINRWMS